MTFTGSHSVNVELDLDGVGGPGHKPFQVAGPRTMNRAVTRLGFVVEMPAAGVPREIRARINKIKGNGKIDRLGPQFRTITWEEIPPQTQLAIVTYVSELNKTPSNPKVKA